MNTFDTGREAEDIAAHYLEKQKFKILHQNWRNKVCEIDIVAKKHNCVYFVEVKYRKTGNQGVGLDYITPAKLRQMTFAASIWVKENDWDGDYELSVISVDKDGITFIEQLDL